MRRLPKRYPIEKIRLPVALFHGGRDGIVDVSLPRERLGKHVALCHVEDEYEHLDFIWADSATERIFPRVLELLGKHCLERSAREQQERQERQERDSALLSSPSPEQTSHDHHEEGEEKTQSKVFIGKEVSKRSTSAFEQLSA